LELKTYLEEFEDKLNKFHMEKKEQEVTARNAQIHQQKIASRGSFNVDKNSEDHSKSNTSSG
jgi:condensin complex subunit 1